MTLYLKGRPAKTFKSECGRYLCQHIGDGGQFEAWLADGSIHYRHDDRIKTWKDAEKRRHPPPYCIGGYSAEKTGQKKGSFTLNLLRCDTRKYVKPYTGNTILESLDIVFRRRVPPQNVPRWLRGDP